MKNKLFTKHSFLGILMGLVMAFGVQGVAEAITKFTRSSGDLQVHAPNTDFTISFNVGLQGRQQAVTTPGKHYIYKVDTSYYYRKNNKYYTLSDFSSRADSSSDTAPDPQPTSLSNVYLYDEEAIDINVMNANVTKIGSYVITPVANPDDLTEGGTNATKLTSRVTLTLSAAQAETVTVTITDTTPVEDLPLSPTMATALAFTVYVAPAHNGTSTIELNTSNTDGLEFSIAEEQIDTDFSYTGTPSEDIRVNYTVSGSGSVYVKTTNNKGSGSKNLTTSSAAPVYLNMNGSTNKVTVSIVGQRPERAKSLTYVYSYATLHKISGDKQHGSVSSRLEDPFVVEVKDGKNRVISGVDVILTGTPGGQGSFLKDSSFPSDLYGTITGNTGTVKTNSRGRANIFLVLGDNTSTGATATLSNATSVQASTVTFTATPGAATAPASIAIVSGDGQRADADGLIEDPLVVVVKDARRRRLMHSNSNPVIVQFLASDGGELTAPTSGEPGTVDGSATTTVINVQTNSDGEASVRYTPPEAGGRRTVRASINNGAKSQTFTINGAAGSGNTGGTQQPAPQTARLTISASSTGTTRTVTVRALTAAETTVPGIPVTLSGTALTTPQQITTGTATTITPPSTAGTYTLFATDTSGAYQQGTTTLTVAALGALAIVLVDTEVNGQQGIEVTAKTAGGAAVSGTLTVTLSGAGVSRTMTATDGKGRVVIALPATAGTLTASATGYTDGTLTLPARTTTTTTTTTGTTTTGTTTTGTTTTGTTTTPTTTTTPPSRISIGGPANRTGTLNEALSAPLLVRVLDDEDEGVEDARVTFRVRKGQGRLSQRGNGRAVAAETDSQGYARADYTPMSASSTVEASVRGVSRTVTFTITATGGATTTTTPTTTTPAPVDVTLKVGAVNRPVMYWITGGALYRQATGDATQIAASAKDVVVDTTGGKLYYIQQTSERTGAIHSANLDGSNAKVVKTLTAAPKGLTLDPANAKLYLSNGWGKIQRMNVDGSRYETNFITGLTDPMHVAVSDGNVYWTEAGGSVRAASLTGAKTPRNIVRGVTVSGLAAGNNKVFWTEQTGTNRGRIRSANPNGTGVSVVYTVTASVQGLAIDPANNRLYWTNGWGKVQRGLTNGNQIQDVVTGLPTPTALAIGGANTTTDATPAKPATPKTPANKYDVNGDGTVDSKDVDTLLLAVLAELTAAKYDVNGDGAVDAKDVRDVNKNLDNGAAGAPTLLGTKFSALEVDRLQEQIDLLIATNDRSPAAMRTLIYLQQLLVMARPEKTQLLANYPNPFNPETWIPYELATDTDVTLTIYNAQGVVIRVLHLGQQSAGYYTDRERAAYWDGRNSQGERVASGIYFYQLETDDMSTLRKMVILK